MQNKKALVFCETTGLDRNFDQSYSKPLRQEIQPVFEFTEPQAVSKNLGIIECYECKRKAELDGYRFRLVPLCRCCRTKREVEITNQNFERRMRKKYD
ncbi:MAG: hypothetical protein ACR2J3_11220 [Aridibacter sp.]